MSSGLIHPLSLGHQASQTLPQPTFPTYLLTSSPPTLCSSYNELLASSDAQSSPLLPPTGMPVAVEALSLSLSLSRFQLSITSGNSSLSFTQPPPLHSAPACIYHIVLESSCYFYLCPLTTCYKVFKGRDPVWFNFAPLVVSTRPGNYKCSVPFLLKK